MADLNVVADYVWNPAISRQEEIELIRRSGQGEDVWAPATHDFIAVTGKHVVCSSLLELLGAVMAHPGKVGRLNVFSHGDAEKIAMKGRIQLGVTRVTVWFDAVASGMSHLSHPSFEQLRQPNTYFESKSGRFTLAAVKKKFSENAVIFLYSCKGGTDVALLQDVADTFGVMSVSGFSKRIAFCPQLRGSRIDRGQIAIEDVSDPCRNSKSVTRNFYSIAPYAAGRGLLRSSKRRPLASEKKSPPALRVR